MKIKKVTDRVAGILMEAAAILAGLLLIVIALTLLRESLPILQSISPGGLLLSTVWIPSEGDFGFLVPILGTLIVTLIAMIIAIPLSLMSAIYLAEYSSEKVRSKILPLIDLLAGIPPVVYGLWGVIVIVPLVADASSSIGRYNIPLIGRPEYSTGYSVLAAGIVLAIMVFPIIISITEQVFRAVPSDVKEASLSTGATRWQTIKHVEIRLAASGIVAAIILGFARAFGETMAVMMVLGNRMVVPSSVFDQGYTLPALIANNYGEMMSIPIYKSALMLAALILMIIILVFTIASRLILIRIERRMANG